MPYIYDKNEGDGGGGYVGLLPRLMVNEDMDLLATLSSTSPYTIEMGDDADLLYDVDQEEEGDG